MIRSVTYWMHLNLDTVQITRFVCFPLGYRFCCASFKKCQSRRGLSLQVWWSDLHETCRWRLSNAASSRLADSVFTQKQDGLELVLNTQHMGGLQQVVKVSNARLFECSTTREYCHHLGHFRRWFQRRAGRRPVTDRPAVQSPGASWPAIAR